MDAFSVRHEPIFVLFSKFIVAWEYIQCKEKYTKLFKMFVDILDATRKVDG